MALIDEWDIHATIEQARATIAEAVLDCSRMLNQGPLSLDSTIMQAHRAAALRDLATALSELECTEGDA